MLSTATKTPFKALSVIARSITAAAPTAAIRGVFSTAARTPLAFSARAAPKALAPLMTVRLAVPVAANAFAFAPVRAFSAEACSTDPAAEPADVVIHRALTAAFAPAKLVVKDTSGGCGAFFNIQIVSEQFAGKTPLARHRMVQAAIKENIKNMHGLTIAAFAPDQVKSE